MDAEKTVRIGSRTHIGRVRDLNEDSLGTPGTQAIARELQEQRGVLVAVADGMGGHTAGEVASRMAIDVLFKTFYTGSSADPGRALRYGFEAANQTILALAASDSTKAGMGTTLVAAVIRGRTLYVANVGDSRAYLIRDKTTLQITRDHTWVAEQVRERVITEEQSRGHAYRNIITRAVGNRTDLQVDLFRQNLKSRDIVVLCTDGLSKVETQEIRQIASNASDPDQAAKELVDLANERGGEDNVSTIVVWMLNTPKRWDLNLVH